MNHQSLWYSVEHELKEMFSDKNTEESGTNLRYLDIKKGDYIYLPNDSSNFIYYIKEGTVKIGSYGDGDREVTQTILNPGEIIGELAIIGQPEDRKDFAYAMEDTHLIGMSIEDIKTMMKDNDDLSLFIMRLMGNRMLKMEKRLESLVLKDSRSRIIEYLIEMYETRGERVGFEYVVRNFITHQEIANITATSRQTVTTVLNELRNADIITFDRRRLLIRDLDRLRAEALTK